MSFRYGGYVITASVAPWRLRGLGGRPAIVLGTSSSSFTRSFPGPASSHAIDPLDRVLEESSHHTSTLRLSIPDKKHWRLILPPHHHHHHHSHPHHPPQTPCPHRGRARVTPAAKDISLSTSDGPPAPVHLRDGPGRPQNQPALALICLHWTCRRDPQHAKIRQRFQPSILICQTK